MAPNFKTRTTSSFAWEYRYAGRRLDLETAIYFFRARYYHAEIGRFISRDPIGYVDGMNLYRAYFVPGAVDPRGTDIVPPGTLDPDYDWDAPIECTPEMMLFGLCPRPPVKIPLYPPLTPPPLGVPGDRFNIRNWVAQLCPCCLNCIDKLFESTDFDFDPEKLQDQCVQWVDLWKPPKDCEKSFTIEMTFWEYPIGIPGTDWWLGHVAARVTACRGKVFFIDNGWWGGKDHVYNRPKPNPWVCPFEPGK